ncbi:hypothetical protein [Bremerella alba]|uniref:Lipoprotein n=1 Tax=Bremerella alba TaxID=980252 RepID=A0A7V8V7J3_9BACT|nr:hypothetical protein [Bremerella alba]MBA2116397.1 hypothetical protein [Bremerella alba]
MKIGKLLLILCAMVVPFTLSGCNTAKTDTADSGEHADDHGHDHGEDGHSHGDEGHSHDLGPHGGHLIELGGEKYHVEWDHDDEAKILTFYVLDADAKKDVAIADENIKITVAVDDAKKDFEVPAVRSEGETTTAKFETKDADLFALVTADEANATVTLEIEGTPYEGEIEHHAH